MRVADYRLVHEVRGRLRLRVPRLGEPGWEAAYLAAWMEAAAPVTEVRVNRAAKALVVHYRGGATGRAAVIRRLEGFTGEEIPGYSEDAVRETELAPMITTAMTLAVLPFLTPRMQNVVTFVNVGSTLAKGADTLIREGVRMEVLDALAVGLAAANGEVYTANATDFLLSLG
jgi:hypothetical protein